jgi:hypothetical protein
VVSVAPLRRLVVLPLLLGCRGAPPHEPAAAAVTAEAPSTPAASSTANTADVVPPGDPAAEPPVVVRPASTPEPGDRQRAQRKLAQCCAALKQLANARRSDQRAGWTLAAFTCTSMRDDPTMDPREALGKVRPLLEGGPVPAVCK